MDETVAHAIRVLVDRVKEKVSYVRGSQVDGAVRVLERELRDYEAAHNEEVK